MLIITAMPFCGSIIILYLPVPVMLFCDSVIILFICHCHAFFVVVLLHSLIISVMLFCDSIILTEQIILYGLERMAVFRCLR